ncbi:MAG: bifunctional UDP-N-acetylglucosamine diphosphorylase/glucosamine-1-phosphate N-acetyltransferase GlmU [Thermomicrobiales bacterium]|nr:bifunctional UDP-N-acetylglucosamine diphosphorylase/glucosamine-1-phosphate N-acetyltransferase GlmU [Thermomicrobiales bacterium]
MSSADARSSLSVVILAAGAGTRMKSALPKPLHPVAGRPMLEHVLTVARSLDPADITIVGSPPIIGAIEAADWAKGIGAAVQDPPRGTGDAVRAAFDAGMFGEIVLILYADHPLVTAEMLSKLIGAFDSGHHRIALLTCMLDDSAGYGRIVRDGDRISAIIEKGDDDPVLRAGRSEINSGVMLLDRNWAAGALARLPMNARKMEYFLTDLVAMAHTEIPGSVIGVEGTPDVLVGVNDRLELAVADRALRERKRWELMCDGVTLVEPETNLIDLDVEIGSDTTVGPGCILESGTRIGSNCVIGPNAIIRASRLGDRVRVESSTIESSTIGNDSDIGPYAHLRAKTRIGAGVHIGNFAELKHALVGDETRIGHFSYIGDATLGKDVNIGAGSITCNFDGTSKHRTTIGDGAFIGSDTMLIAPVEVGAGGRTGAGAVVSRNVAEGATVVGMPAREVHRMPVEPANTDGKERG